MRAASSAVDAGVDELRQAGVLLVEHAEGGVAGVDEARGGLGDPQQHGVEVELGAR